MIKRSFLSALVVLGFGAAAHAITCTYEVYDEAAKTCKITGWTGDAPSGSWTIPSSAKINGTQYTIVHIAPHALDNMPAVTQINIPATITSIGSNGDGPMGPAENFYGCPKLLKFAVNSANPVYKADGLGCLIRPSVSALVKVPQAVIVTASSFQVTYSEIIEDAFAENSTISSLTLSGNETLYGNPGFNTMTKLAKFVTTASNGKLKAVNDMLYSQDQTVLRFCPPRLMVSSFAAPSSLKELGDFAFGGCIYLGSFSTSPSQTLKIGKSAFAGSGLLSIVINENFQLSAEGFTFYNCKSLKTITFNGNVTTIPTHFATGCSSLTTVNYRKNQPATLKSGAFKNCTSLKDYPFSASYFAEYDSVLANIGVVELVYNSAAPNQAHTGSESGWYTFTDCQNLTKIDLMNIDITNRAYTIANNFADNCRKLKEVYLPRLSNFANALASEDYYFGEGSNLEKIALGSYTVVNKEPLFIYSGNKTFEPTIYLRPDLSGRGQYYTIADAIQLKDGAKLKPTFFIESLTPPDFYLYSNATYYIPPFARDNYTQVLSVGGVIKSMYTLSVIKQNDEVCFYVATGLEGRIKIDKVIINAKEFYNPAASIISTGLSQEEFKEITIHYTVDNVAFQNTYPASEFFASGIEDINVDDKEIAPRYFDLQGREVLSPAKGHLYIVRRGASTAKEIY